MEKKKTDPAQVWDEYNKCITYNASIGLYERVRQNEDFFIGDQWKGVVAPDLEKPVINFLKRVVTYLLAMLATDDISADVRTQNSAAGIRNAGTAMDEAGAMIPVTEQVEIPAASVAQILDAEIDKVLEKTKAKTRGRLLLRNSAVDGDGYFYTYIRQPKNRPAEICIEVIDNDKVLYIDPYTHEAEEQTGIIICQRLPLEKVRRMAEELGTARDEIEKIIPDGGGLYSSEESGFDSNLVTVLTKFWKENGTVWFTKTTEAAVIVRSTDTGLTRYPVAGMPWELKKDGYHGQAVLTGLIPNQIFVNKMMAMAMEQEKRLAFPKIFYNGTLIGNWTNKVGEAVRVAGDPNLAVASSWRAADMSDQVLLVIDRIISYSKDFMGANDAALGNITNPDNTSAIIAVQKASQAPLELQRLAYYQLWEDEVYILIEMICRYYGLRDIDPEKNDAGISRFDFAQVDLGALDVAVDVGASSYWSELMQVQTADALFSNGVFSDVVDYLKRIPDQYVRDKKDLIKKIEEQRQMQQEQAEKQTAAAQEAGMTPEEAEAAAAGAQQGEADANKAQRKALLSVLKQQFDSGKESKTK